MSRNASTRSQEKPKRSSLSLPETETVLGLNIARTNYAEAAEIALRRSENKEKPFLIAAANTHLTTLARHSKSFGEAMREFDLICPDGMPLVWALNQGKKREEKLRDRVYGPELMLRVFQASNARGSDRHFLIGGPEETLESLRRFFGERYPKAPIVGMHCPPFRKWDEADDAVVSRSVAESKANVVWIGLGCPKQELLLARIKNQLSPAAYFAVGAAFAFHAGQVPQAPRVLQRAGLEWVFRLLVEPRRLGSRYLKFNFLFCYYYVRSLLY
ncbi:MAG: WecB/TagA/CpsF family glycosyltransferase [Verrucomicrobiota bacterium]